MNDYPILEKYSEYRDALDIVCYFNYLVKNKFEINCDLNNLRISELDILSKIVKITKRRKTTYGIFTCDFCGSLVTFTPEGTRKSDGSIITTKGIRKCCGSKECEDKYSAFTTNNNRSQPHALNKKKTKLSRKDKAMNFNFDTPEKDAAKAMGVATDTLKKRRLKGDIPPHVYTKIGYKMIRYCLPLLKDWQLDPDDIAAQARAIELVQDSRPSNAPRKRGRKAAA